jgi:hypothetical protein
MALSALVGLLTSAIAAWIVAKAKALATTQRQRQRLREDQEFVERLPEGSTARRHLEASMQERIIRASYEEVFNVAANSIVVMATFFFVFGGSYIAVAAIAAPPDIRTAVMNTHFAILALIFVVLEVAVLSGAAYDRRQVDKRRAQFFESGLYPSPLASKGNKTGWFRRVLGLSRESAMQLLQMSRARKHVAPRRRAGAVIKPLPMGSRR